MDIFELFKKIEKKNSVQPITHIICGLGNPGKEYELTRHNAGFLAIDYIAAECGVKIDRLKFHALTAEAVIGDLRVLLMKPQTYMNNSGEAVGEASAFYKIPPQNVIILHDEISFDAGIIRIRRKGSAGGHNGLKSIIAHLNSEEFPRIKIGVGKKPTPETDLVSWVLGRLPDSDIEKIKEKFEPIRDSVMLIASGKTDDAMCKYSR